MLPNHPNTAHLLFFLIRFESVCPLELYSWTNFLICKAITEEKWVPLELPPHTIYKHSIVNIIKHAVTLWMNRGVRIVFKFLCLLQLA